MILQLPSFKCVLSASVGAEEWILVALQMMDFGHVFNSGVVVFAVLARKRSLSALLCLVQYNTAELKPFPTAVTASTSTNETKANVFFYFTTPVRDSSGACLLLGCGGLLQTGLYCALCLFVGLVGELLLWSCDQEIFELSYYAAF